MSWHRYLYSEVQPQHADLPTRLRNWLFPTDESEDPTFREGLNTVALGGLRAGALVYLGAILWTLVLENVFGQRSSATVAAGPFGHLTGVAASLAALGISYVARLRRYARLVGACLGLLAVILNSTMSLAVLPEMRPQDHHLPGNLIMTMLIVVALMPFKPIHTVLFGASIVGVHVTSTWAVPYFLETSERGNPGHALETVLGLLVAVALTSVIYRQRASAHRARQAAVQALQSLQEVQSRLLVSKNAASQGRLAAALSHELNTPLGVLGSSLASLEAYYRQHGERGAAASREVLLQIVEAARKSARRLSDVVARMGRFTNLDRAEVQSRDVNDLLTDTVELLKPELGPKVATQLDLEQLPQISCRPQALSAVFSNVIRNAAKATEGKGGHIWVSTRRRHDEVIVEIRDDGEGIPSDRLSHLFEPSFDMRGQTVTSSNWGLFTSRNIVVEHGGQIAIDSEQGEGTTVTITLPITTGR